MIIDRSEIINNSQIAKGIWKMVFKSAKIANEYLGAGQFVSIIINDSWEHPIRRPISIAEVIGKKISIIYKVFGPVTQAMTQLKSKEIIDVLGPLGNTFYVDHSKYYPILIGGGIGLAPILNLSETLTKKGVNFTTIIGAKIASEHFLQHIPSTNMFLCTDDGTIGIKGTVVDGLKFVLENIKNSKIFACGPEKMLLSIQNLLENKNIPAQFSVESYMACGVGLCQGCAISKRKDIEYYLVCKDGPVFESNEVRFD